MMTPKRWLLTLIFTCLCFKKSFLIKHLIIRQVLKNKGNYDCDMAWISDLNEDTFLWFYFSVVSLLLVLIEKIYMYQTLNTVFDHISNHLVAHKHSSLHVILSTFFSVFGNVIKKGFSCLIYYFLKLLSIFLLKAFTEIYYTYHTCNDKWIDNSVRKTTYLMH